jgi:hypothetical protein
VLPKNFTQRAQRVSVASVRNLFLDRREHREKTRHRIEILVSDMISGSRESGQIPIKRGAIGFPT